jgi:hypothetical protein
VGHDAATAAAGAVAAAATGAAAAGTAGAAGADVLRNVEAGAADPLVLWFTALLGGDLRNGIKIR